MAGDVFHDGGFVVLNSVTFDAAGQMVPLAEPYPGSNLFSLASGGALYIRDPGRRVVPQQLNGGVFTALTGEDWDLIRPYLEENERLFGIRTDELLMVDGVKRTPDEVYRKVTPARLAALSSARPASGNGGGNGH